MEMKPKTYLDELEAETICILREAAAEDGMRKNRAPWNGSFLSGTVTRYGIQRTGSPYSG